MTMYLPRLITALAISAVVLPAAAADRNETDLIKGMRTNGLLGGLPDPVGDFAITESRSDPNRHTIRARYEHRDGDAAAVVNIRAVRAKGKVVELPDGPDSVAVGVDGVLKEHNSQKGSRAERIDLDEANGSAMNCVKVTREDETMVRLVCRTAVHGRMIESQSDARVGDIDAPEAMARLERFTQDMVSAVRAIEPRDR